AQGVVEAGLCPDEASLHAYADAMRDLHHDPEGRRDLAWGLGVTAEVLVPERRRREIRNFLDHLVRPRTRRA
ncbi:glutamine amidotransferase, partial [Methylobacterium frigidaeris]